MMTVVAGSRFGKMLSILLALCFLGSVFAVDVSPSHAGFFSKIGKAFKKIGGALTGVVKKVTSTVSKVASSVKTFVTSKVLPVVKKFAPILGVAASIVAPYLAPAMASIMGAIGTGAKIASSAISLIESKGRNLFGAISGLAGNLGGALGGIAQKVTGIVGNISGQIGQIAQGGISGILGKITSLPAVQGIIGSVSGILKSGTGILQGTIGNLQGVIGKFGGMVTNFTQNGLPGLVGQIQKVIGNNPALAGLQGKVGEISKSLSGIFQKLTATIPGSKGLGTIPGIGGPINLGGAPRLPGLGNTGNLPALGNFQRMIGSLDGLLKSTIGRASGQLQGFLGQVQNTAGSLSNPNVLNKILNTQAERILVQVQRFDKQLSRKLGDVSRVAAVTEKNVQNLMPNLKTVEDQRRAAFSFFGGSK